MTDVRTRLTQSEVSDLINHTCNDVLELTSETDELTSLLDVVVNVMVSRLTDPAMSVREAIAENWPDHGVDEVIGWLP